MKIYTKLIIDIESDQIEQEGSFEYTGPLSECKGGGGEIKETSHEKELARISQEQWNQYKTRFRPFENEWISNIRTDQNDQAQIAGQVNAGVGREFDKIQKTAKAQQFSAGMDPSSGRFKAVMGGLSSKRGETAGRAKSAASQAVDDQTYQGLQQAVAMGRGQSAEATRDMTSLAYDATGKAIADAKADQDTSQTWASSAMSAAGMGLAGCQNKREMKPKAWINPDTGKEWKP